MIKRQSKEWLERPISNGLILLCYFCTSRKKLARPLIIVFSDDMIPLSIRLLCPLGGNLERKLLSSSRATPDNHINHNKYVQSSRSSLSYCHFRRNIFRASQLFQFKIFWKGLQCFCKSMRDTKSMPKFRSVHRQTRFSPRFFVQLYTRLYRHSM